jgi:ArsR family transcriptional regulator
MQSLRLSRTVVYFPYRALHYEIYKPSQAGILLTETIPIISLHSDIRMENVDQAESLIDLMGSLADPKRLRILRLLERNELDVTELCDVLQLPQSTISRHLKVLGDLGWARNRRQGTNHLYRTLLDELEPSARRLWLLVREQTDAWPAIAQDQLRLNRVLQQRTADGESFFAGAAGDWDNLRGEFYGQQFSTIACLALLPRIQTVADLGCGTGEIAAQISPFVKSVIAVDNSPAMLRAAKRRLAEAKNVELRRGDLSALPIDSGACDAAMIVLALTYVPGPQDALNEMARILRPGGRAVIVDLLHHDRDDFRRHMGQRWPGFELQKIEQWLADSGLQVEICRPLPPEQNAKGPALLIATARKARESGEED